MSKLPAAIRESLAKLAGDPARDETPADGAPAPAAGPPRDRA
jgi:hypothetical protein